MTDDLIGPEDVTAQTVLEILTRAYLNAEIDADGDVLYTGQFHCWLTQPDGGWIRFLSFFRSKPDQERAAKLEFVDRFNGMFRVVRASLDKDGDFRFDYYFPIHTGLNPRALIDVLRRFESIIDDLAEADTDGVVS